MSVTDYVIDVLLIAIILRQVRPHALTARFAVLPLVLLAAAWIVYFRSFTVSGNDLALIVILSAVGVGLGGLSGLGDRLRHDHRGLLVAQAGFASVGAWVLGMGFRFWFDYYANHGGARSVVRFSVRHDISGPSIWTAALVLMASGQVFTRVGVLQARRIRAANGAGAPWGYSHRSAPLGGLPGPPTDHKGGPSCPPTIGSSKGPSLRSLRSSLRSPARHRTGSGELNGRYLRNGPNPLGVDDPGYHWFVGPGMVHGVRLRDGRAEWYRNRWVRSRLLAESLGETWPAGPIHADSDFAANTHIIAHAGRIPATVEAGPLPYELTDELDTVGPCDFDGTLEALPLTPSSTTAAVNCTPSPTSGRGTTSSMLSSTLPAGCATRPTSWSTAR